VSAIISLTLLLNQSSVSPTPTPLINLPYVLLALSAFLYQPSSVSLHLLIFLHQSSSQARSSIVLASTLVNRSRKHARRSLSATRLTILLTSTLNDPSATLLRISHHRALQPFSPTPIDLYPFSPNFRTYSNMLRNHDFKY